MNNENDKPIKDCKCLICGDEFNRELGCQKCEARKMMTKYKQPKAFSSISCEECQTRENLTQNKYTDAILCNSCLIQLLEEIEIFELGESDESKRV